MNKYLTLTISAKISRLSISPMLQPALPIIAASLAVSTTTAKYTWVILTLSYVFAQLFLMIWGDRATVKKILVSTLPVSLIGSLFCLINSIYAIQVGMFCVGFGCSITATLGNVLLREVDSDNAKSSIAITSIFGSLVPIIALVAAGNLIDYAGWRYVFVILFLLNFITWIIAIFLKSIPRCISPHRLSIFTETKKLLQMPNYLTLLWFFISYTTISGIVYIILPFLAITYYHMPSHIYAYALIPSYVMSSVGSVLCAKLIPKISTGWFISIGLIFCYCGLVLFFLFNFYHFSIIYIITIATSVYFLGLGMFYPFANATAVLLVKDEMSSYSISFFILVTMIGQAIIMMVATHLNDRNSLQFAYLTLALLLSSTLGAILFTKFDNAYTKLASN